MKTSILALSLLAVSSSSMASIKDYKFVALDNSESTNLCVVSAQEGFQVAKKMGEAGVEYIRCNGQSIRNFARKFQASASPVSATKYTVVASNSKAESQICAKAASDGVHALKISREELTSITCNGLSVRSFARAYSN